MKARSKHAVVDASRFAAVVFDMDGVLTDTAGVHFGAWKQLFDETLTVAAFTGGCTGAATFELGDYLRLVDGRSRVDGVAAVLAERGVALAVGRPDDPPGAATVWALANRKDLLFLDALRRDGVHVFATSVVFVRAVRAAGLATAVVTASRHRHEILVAAGIDDLFDAHIDGVDVAELGLAGKPAPDMFVAASVRLGVDPASAVVVEDAVAGVAAGRAGGFGLVVGVDRTGSADALADAGADVVVGDIGDIGVVGVRIRAR